MIKKSAVFMMAVLALAVLLQIALAHLQYPVKPLPLKVKTTPTPTPIPRDVKVVMVREKTPPPAKPKPAQLRAAAPQQRQTKADPATARPAATPRPRAVASAARPVKPLTLQADPAMIAAGRRLLRSKTGAPLILAAYDRIGFSAYLHHMTALGGRLYVGDAHAQKLLARVKLNWRGHTPVFAGLDFSDLGNLSAMALFRPREIADEAWIDQIVAATRRQVPAADPRGVVLLPIDKEAACLGAMRAYLAQHRQHIAQFDLFQGQYIARGDAIVLHMQSGRLAKTGQTIALDLTLRL